MVVQSASRDNINNTINNNNNKGSFTMSTTSGAVPSDAIIQLISPDGYYTYFGIPKPTAADIAKTASDVSSSFVPATDKSTKSKKDGNNNSSSSSSTMNERKKIGAGGGVDPDEIKKKYRKLSLKHHPDKGGDVDTFRAINRAMRVLLDDKLRKQYDILGLDLDDDEDTHLHSTTTSSSSGSGSAGHHGGEHDGDGDEAGSQGIVHEIATMLMAALMHLGIKTAMVCAVATIITRYLILVVPAILFMLYIAYTVLQEMRLPDNHPGKRGAIELAGPFALIFGLLCMHVAHSRQGFLMQCVFFLGESTGTFMFIFNSIRTSLPVMTPVVLIVIAFVASALALIFRGKFWNYFIAMLFEAGLLLVVVMAFPVIEMMLETILNEKLRKVGDKVRAHQKQLEAYYASKVTNN